MIRVFNDQIEEIGQKKPLVIVQVKTQSYTF